MKYSDQLKQAVSNAISEAENSKVITPEFTRWGKEILIKRLWGFKTEDFEFYADDGNTPMTPESHYAKLTEKELKTELSAALFQLDFHEVDGERGVNLLRCCSRCRDLYLRRLFEIHYMQSIMRKR